MRKLIAGFAASLDGYISGPNGEYDWILIDKEIDFAEQAKRFDTYFYGRRTYEDMLKMNSGFSAKTKNYVFSKTLKEVKKNVNLVSENVKEIVLKIKEEEGKHIALFGGASLLASLLDLELVDEIEIAFIPVLLGKGKPMVEVLNDKVWLDLISYKKYSNGTIQVTYIVKPKKDQKKGPAKAGPGS